MDSLTSYNVSDLDTFLIISRIKFVVFVLFSRSIWGRLILGNRAGKSVENCFVACSRVLGSTTTTV